MREFYEQFYTAVEHSPVHATFCRRAFGLDLAQHGFAGAAQVQAVMDVTGMAAGHRVLDLGCGNGRCAEYLSDCTGAHVLGLDYVPAAVDSARRRTAGKEGRLAFEVGDINDLALAPASLDIVVSIDSLYFSHDLARTLAALRAALRPGGQMAILYSHGREPWVPLDEFDASTLPPANTPLGQALQSLGAGCVVQDFTADEYRLALLRRQVLAELRPQFEAEGLMFIYDNRMGDSQGVAEACERGLHRRYLYHVRNMGIGEPGSRRPLLIADLLILQEGTMAEGCKPDLKMAAVCGLFCPGCAIFIAAHETPEKREEIAAARGWPAEAMVCEGCRAEVRFSYCQTCTLYTCAAGRGLDFCGACADYPCADLRAFQEARPHRRELWQNQARIQEVGWRQWFAEMAEHYACSQCGALNAAYLPACRRCGHRPSCGYVAGHQAAIDEYELTRRP